jgi:hypothetical protein
MRNTRLSRSLRLSQPWPLTSHHQPPPQLWCARSLPLSQSFSPSLSRSLRFLSQVRISQLRSLYLSLSRFCDVILLHFVMWNFHFWWVLFDYFWWVLCVMGFIWIILMGFVCDGFCCMNLVIKFARNKLWVLSIVKGYIARESRLHLCLLYVHSMSLIKWFWWVLMSLIMCLCTSMKLISFFFLYSF